MNVGSLLVTLGLDIANLRRGLNEASNQLNLFQRETNVVGNAIKGLLAGFGVAGAWKWLVSGNAQMEQYQQTLNIVMGDTKKAAETLQWAQKFAAQTPFELPGIVDATVKLQAYGINARKVLGDIGDMASAMGKPLDQAVEAIADASTGELERLREFGITKQMLIEKSAKMGMQEIINAKGQITNMQGLNEALFALIRERYHGAMEAQKNTLSGMLSNLKDWMGTTGRTLGEDIFKGVKVQLSDLLNYLNQLSSSGQLEAWGKGIGNTFSSLIGIFKAVKDNSGILIPIISGLAASFTTMKIIGLITTLMAAYRNSLIITTIAQEGLTAAMRANPIGMLIIAIGLLISAGVALYRNWDSLGSQAAAVASVIVAFFNRMVVSVATGFNQLGHGILSLLQRVMNAVSPVVGIIGKIAPGFESGFEKAQSAVNKKIGDIDLNLKELGVSAEAAGKKLSSAMSGVGNAFKPSAAWAGEKKVAAPKAPSTDTASIDDISKAFSNLSSAAGEAGDKATKAAKDTRSEWEKTLDTLQSKLQAVQAQGEVKSISLSNASETDKLSASLSNLSQQYDIQKQIVGGLQTAYEKLVATKGQSNQETASAATKYAQEAKTLSDLANKINEAQLALAKQSWVTAAAKEDIEILNAEHEKESALLNESATKIAELTLQQRQQNESINAQSELIKDLNREYKATKELKGADAEETRKSYMELIKAQTEEAKLRKELRDTNKALEEQAKKLQETTQKAQDLAKKYQDDMTAALDAYQKKVSDTNNKLAEDEQSLTDKYNNAVSSRAKTLTDWVSLFDAVPQKQDVSGQNLLNNLQGQVTAFEDWQSSLKSLASRGVDEGLISELQQMGPKAGDQISALNTLTDTELNQYVLLWQEKSSLATQEATSELTDLQAETQAKIAQLRTDIAAQLEQYRQEWEDKNKEIRENTAKELQGMVTDAQKAGQDFVTAIQQAFAGVSGFESILGISTTSSGQADQAGQAESQRKGVTTQAQQQTEEHAAIVQTEMSNLLQSWTDTGSQLSAKQSEIKTQTISTWQQIQQQLFVLWNKINADLKKGWTDNRNFIFNILAQVDTRFKATESAASMWGSNLMSNFIDGIRSRFGDLQETLLAMSMEVENYIGFHSPTKKGPGSDADTWAPNLVKMLASGIEDELPLLTAANEQLINAIRTPMTSTIPTAPLAAVSGGGDTFNINITGSNAEEIWEQLERKLYRHGVRWN